MHWSPSQMPIRAIFFSDFVPFLGSPYKNIKLGFYCIRNQNC
jgi:hypothetical protein